MEKTSIGVSARHVHLTQEVVDILFGAGHILEPVGPAAGQFLSTSRVTVIGPKGKFERVAVMGPCRKLNQLEISLTDTRTLGIPAPIRMSGDIEGTPGFTLVGPAGEITLEKGAIVAKRHIHMGGETAARQGVADGDSVLLCIKTAARTLVLGDTIIRVGGPGNVPGMAHIDTDEGNAACVDKDTYGYIIGKTDSLPAFEA